MASGINDEGLSDEVVDYLGQVRVSEFFSQYNYITIHPGWPDDLRFNVTLNSGTVQNSELQTTGSGQNPIVRTQDTANYAPGSPAIFGSGTSIVDVPTDDQSVEWGADDGTDAVGFGRDSTGAYIYYMDNGAKTKIYENDQGNGGWNGEEIRGFNQFENNRICWVDHLWYKGGPIAWRVLDYYDMPKESTMRTIHVEKPPVISNPNLPSYAAVDSGTTSSTCTLELDAVHYIKGEEEQESRTNGEFVDQGSIDDTQWYHLISWETRDGWDAVEVQPAFNQIFASGGDLKLQLLLNPSLTVNTARDLPGGTSSSETAVKVTTDATLDNATSPNERRWIGTAPGGSGNKAGAVMTEELSFDLPANQAVTLAAKAFSGGSGITARGASTWQELF